MLPISLNILRSPGQIGEVTIRTTRSESPVFLNWKWVPAGIVTDNSGSTDVNSPAFSLSLLLHNCPLPERKYHIKRPLFSRKEIVQLARRFILAYIRGEITFDLVIKPETYKRRLEVDGTPIDEVQKLFFQIPDTMLKCVWLIETNEEEYDACIDMLFKFMILGRATKSIDGQFLMDLK